MFELSSPSSQPLPLRLSIVGQNNSNNIDNNTPSQKKKRKSLSLTISITGPSSLDEENRPEMPITNLITKASDSTLLLNESSRHSKKSPRIEHTDSESDHHTNKSPRIERTNTATSEHTEVTVTESSPNHTIGKSTCTTGTNDDNMKDIATNDINIDNLPDSSFHNSYSSPKSSDCETEVSSVSQRKTWLKSFEKQQANNLFRSIVNDSGSLKNQTRDNDDSNHNEARSVGKEARQSPPSSSKAISRTDSDYSNSIAVNSASIATVTKQQTPGVDRKRSPVINRRVGTSMMTNTWRSVKKEEVKATDDGYASVASLSKWLEADPTSAKKKRHVRRGRNIISKSRQFEKDLENTIVMESKIPRGAVGDRKKWLHSAFRSSAEEDRDDDDTSSTFSGYVQSDVGVSTGSYSHYNRKCTQTEIITNDAASSLSVADKKNWLKEAFPKKSQERKRFGDYSRAQTDVLHNRGKAHDEVASRAKLRFKERSARKLLNTSSSSLKAASPTRSKRPTTLSSSSSITIDTDKANMKVEYNITSDKESVFRSKNIVQIAESTEEDSTPMDFRAAREALVQRSKKNGHNTQVVNKVFLRKKEFEDMEDKSRRKSMGLVLKSSWDLGDPSRGRPSTVYERKYTQAQDIAPKKSFEELP